MTRIQIRYSEKKYPNFTAFIASIEAGKRNSTIMDMLENACSKEKPVTEEFMIRFGDILLEAILDKGVAVRPTPQPIENTYLNRLESLGGDWG